MRVLIKFDEIANKQKFLWNECKENFILLVSGENINVKIKTKEMLLLWKSKYRETLKRNFWYSVLWFVKETNNLMSSVYTSEYVTKKIDEGFILIVMFISCRKFALTLGTQTWKAKKICLQVFTVAKIWMNQVEFCDEQLPIDKKIWKET